MDPPLGSGGCLCDGRDEGVAYGVLAPFQGAVVVGDVHDGLIKLLLDELVLSEPLLANSQLCADIRGALPLQTLKLVVLGAEHLLLLAE